MIQHFIKKSETQTLNLFFTGWGMDEQPLSGLELKDDLLICYDYSNLDFDASLIRSYSRINILGWSMGVWAASLLISKGIITPHRSVAINGTMYPVDNERGINVDIFHGTERGLNEASLNKFQRRMCQDSNVFAQFKELQRRRSIEELRTELRAIEEASLKTDLRNVKWDLAVVGKKDMIFTYPNQINGWKECASRIIEKDIPHYSFDTIAEMICNNEINEI